jgi:hypothetical protein
MPAEAVIEPFVVKESFWPECGRMIEQFEMNLRGVPPGFLFWARVVSREDWTSL